jgi:mercuric ion binding protein
MGNLAAQMTPKEVLWESNSIQPTGLNTCPVCPITVKKALSKVDGVSKVEVSYEKKEARG